MYFHTKKYETIDHIIGSSHTYFLLFYIKSVSCVSFLSTIHTYRLKYRTLTIIIQLFLSLSAGKSKEAEIKRINKELANIRSKFKGDKTLDGYQKKKYVCKLLFIFLLGHDIDFGHMEAVNLLSSNKYSEKQIVSCGRCVYFSILLTDVFPFCRVTCSSLCW